MHGTHPSLKKPIPASRGDDKGGDNGAVSSLSLAALMMKEDGSSTGVLAGQSGEESSWSDRRDAISSISVAVSAAITSVEVMKLLVLGWLHVEARI